MKTGNVLYINEKQAKTMLNMKQVIGLMEKCFREYASGNVLNPVKLHLGLRPHVEGYINSMPSYMIESNLMGVKLVGCWVNNPPIGIPTSIGIIVLFVPQTGVPYAIVDGTFITNIRTGAVVGVQAKYLAKKGSSIVTFIGAGAQGYTSMQAVEAAMDTLKEVRLVDINPAALEKYLAKAEREYPNLTFTTYDDIQTAVKGSDIVVSCAIPDKPLLEGIEFDPGTTVISVSEPFRSPEWIKNTFSKMVADFPECLITRMNQEGLWLAQKSGKNDFVEMPFDIVDETLGDIIIGKAAGRTNDKEVIFSATVGMSMEDVICAQAVYETATEKGIGVELEFMDLEGYRQGR